MALELLKQPETQREYWETIEGLGGYTFGTNHGLAHEHIKDTDGKVAASIESAHQIQQRIARELSEKFGIILPQDYPNKESHYNQPPAPEGKTYYWDWYEKMKSEVLTEEWDTLICSACPISEGAEGYIRNHGERIPCKAFRGSIYHLRPAFNCGMLYPMPGDWTREDLMKNVYEAGAPDGLQAVSKFLAKEEQLKTAYST